MNWPKVSIVVPTLNASAVLENCLSSIRSQDYPKELIELIISDGGSTDATIEIAKKYQATVFSNPLMTAESGKAVGVKKSTGEFIALIDSDNILPSDNWLKEMIQPLLDHPYAVGSEPWSYTYRKSDGFITRYCALTGFNDPLVLAFGNYDRQNLITNKWTEIEHAEKDCGNYLLCEFDGRGLPTIGANGTVFRTDFQKSRLEGNYLFDIDILSKEIQKNGKVIFIKVKNGIIHTFCERSISKFIKKQRRRVNDLFFHTKVARDRSYDWEKYDFSGAYGGKAVKYVLYCLTIIPLLYQTLKGFFRRPDPAWFFHPLASEITLLVYGYGRLRSQFINQEEKRNDWKQ